MSSSPLPFTITTKRTATGSRSSLSSSSNLKSPLILPRSAVFFRSSKQGAAGSFKCVFSPVKATTVAELVKDKESIAASKSECEVEHSRTFLDARTEQELLNGIKKEVEAGRLPPNVAAGMEELYHNYRNAVFQSGDARADETVLSNMAVALDRVLLDVEVPYDFSPYHKALREPFDYYMFGQNYIRPLIDFTNSYVGNVHLFYEIEEKLKQGHNVVLTSNHQAEADPAVIALLLEKTNPHITENMTYVAGDRVLTDPLCKPFSMGRNLICVYSKKHIYDVPELAEMKRKANTRSLKEMALLLRGGSQIIWIAPSGGRDRPDTHTGEWNPAPFDSSAVDNIRWLAEHSGPPAHVYPLALLCYDIMPPPPQVEKEIGEKRVVSFHGAGLSVAPEISFPEVGATYKNSEEAKEAYSLAMYNSVIEQYSVLKSAIHGKKGLGASISSVSLSQPWN